VNIEKSVEVNQSQPSFRYAVIPVFVWDIRKNHEILIRNSWPSGPDLHPVILQQTGALPSTCEV
jgi:hypothetical protein